jgi:dTDP-glucose pyrophosphorylase
MAGMGTRFSAAGFKDIKPLIPIHGRPMISHVIDSVGINGDWIFIVQKIHREKYNLDEILNNLKPGCKIIDTGGTVTEGAAVSILLAKEFINNDRPLIIINSDNIIKWDVDLFNINLLDDENNVDGLILCFKDSDPKWSFAKLNNEDIVTEVAEKNPISDNATAGLYVWKRGKDFVIAAEQMIYKNIRIKNEFYLCPVYNENIELGHKIIIGYVDEMNGVGTPEDLERYLLK